MAAIFYTYGGEDIFHGNLSFQSPINVSFMSSLFGSENLAIITELAVGTTETLQFFLSFDDVINFMHFGKGMGTINISGILFSNCSGNIPGLGKFYELLGSIRGTLVSVSVGRFVFKGTVTASSLSVVSEPDTMAQFQLQIGMTDHSLAQAVRPISSFSGSTATPGFAASGGATFGSGSFSATSGSTFGATQAATQAANVTSSIEAAAAAATAKQVASLDFTRGDHTLIQLE